MKKRIIALASALILTFGMAVSVCAAPSASTGTTATTVVAISVDTPISDAQAASFASTTKVTTTVAGAEVKPVTGAVATTAAAQAKETVGTNAAIATVVDLHVPEGTGKADFTLSVPTVKAGQRIVVLHQKKDGTWEKIDPSSVKDGSVTFTMTSYSPVAIVIENASETTTVVTPAPVASAADPAPVVVIAKGTAPKTGDVMVIIAFMASICLAGTVVFTKKALR